MYIQHLGAIKIKQLAEITTEDRMIRFHVQVGGGRGGRVLAIAPRPARCRLWMCWLCIAACRRVF